MTSAAHDTTPSPTERKAEQTTGDVVAMTVFVAILVIGSVLILWNGRALTPDFVDRAEADGPSLMLTLGAFTAILGFGFISGIACLCRMMLTSFLFVIAAWFTMVWTMASLMPFDFDGRFNPYVRRMDPLPSQYEDLAAAKSLPAVAAQIRTATADGRVDRGEAHDILNGETYYAASAEAYRRKQETLRRKVLAP